MATYDDILEAILGRLESGFSAIDIDWPGVQFIPEPSDDAWLRVGIIGLGGDEIDIEDGCVEISGELECAFFSRMGKSDKVITGHMDSVRALFPRGLKISTSSGIVRFFEAQPAFPVQDSEGWYQEIVKFPFHIFTST